MMMYACALSLKREVKKTGGYDLNAADHSWGTGLGAEEDAEAWESITELYIDSSVLRHYIINA